MQNMIRNLTLPDFEVSVDGSMIILKRVKERYFPFLHSSMDWGRKAWRCETEQKVSR